MWKYPTLFDVIVIGAGHAGCEAAYASSRMGSSTLLLTMNLDTIGKMSCNPAIGGTAKGHIVREIDALGGIMGKVADETGIQFRMLNASKGPAVRSPRAQSDKIAYQTRIKFYLENQSNLEIQQGTIDSLIIEKDRICGVCTKEGIKYFSKTVILCSGTFMRGLMHMGQKQMQGGRSGDRASMGLSPQLINLGFKLGRLKTGTPPRILNKNIDYHKMEEQPGEENVCFSYDEKIPRMPQTSCWITYTTSETQKIVLDHLHLSPLYSGIIEGVGPRYCPSIEDKYVRFADKPRHQIFLEPEGISTNEIYVNGISTSLPIEIQRKMLHSIIGLEKAQMTRFAYAIEYDYILSGQIQPTMESNQIEGLYLAGQLNGTTGYEEAAGQGLVAGINATLKVQNNPSFILKRSESYIGVLIDDITTMDLDEPYRMFTSRAENRLLLRQDNADLRLRKYGYELGLITKEQFQRLEDKKQRIVQTIFHLEKTFVPIHGKNCSLAQILKRPEMNYEKLHALYPKKISSLPIDIQTQVEMDLKYKGYIQRQEKEVQKLNSLYSHKIPKTLSYQIITGLRNEAKEKLEKFKPENLGSASKISGVSPADLSVLLVHLQKSFS